MQVGNRSVMVDHRTTTLVVKSTTSPKRNDYIAVLCTHMMTPSGTEHIHTVLNIPPGQE